MMIIIIIIIIIKLTICSCLHTVFSYRKTATLLCIKCFFCVLQVKTLASELYEQYFKQAEATPRGVVAKLCNIVQQLESACAMQINQVKVCSAVNL